MKLYCEEKDFKLYQGNMLDMLEVIEPESVDSIVTDPPYELNFMGKGWDNSGIAFQKETWEKCYVALKAGGYLLAFGGSRTFHRIACAIEDAGFEIRDTIMWLYGSGFPKSMNIGLAIDKKNGVDNRTGNIRADGKATNSGSGCYNCNTDGENSMRREFEERKAQNEWNGWGTCLKPAYEPIIVARKHCEGSCVDNVLKYGVGGINIDECRVETNEDIKVHNYTQNSGIYGKYDNEIKEHSTNQGRFPANVILTYDETDEAEVCSGFPKTKSTGGNGTVNDFSNYGGSMMNQSNRKDKNKQVDIDKKYAIDEGNASRYFYCAKASRRDRDEGLETFANQYMAFSNQAKAELKRGNVDFKGNEDNPLHFANSVSVRKNIHPTVKPTDLMQYLVRLVTPNGGTVLDPFNGSGSTGKAVMYENKDRDKGYKYIGIEMTEEYLPIAQARIAYAINGIEEEQEIEGQVTIWDI